MLAKILYADRESFFSDNFVKFTRARQSFISSVTKFLFFITKNIDQ